MKTIIAHDRCVLLHGDSAGLAPILAPDSIDAMDSAVDVVRDAELILIAIEATHGADW